MLCSLQIGIRMHPCNASPTEQGGGLGLKESRKSDEFWMLKLIYPRAVNLDEYLEVWLNEIIAATPSSTSAAAITSFGGPTSYLSRLSDSPAFKQVSREGEFMFDV